MKNKLKCLLLPTLLCLFFSCDKADLDQVSNLNNGRIQVIRHGGSGFQSYFNPIPHNSMRSVSRALDGLNVEGVEVDAQLTADRQLVLYHDEQLETLTDCFGCISDQTAEAVLNCRYNLHAGNNLGVREPLILLETVLVKASTYARKPQVFIDLKVTNNCDPHAVPQPEEYAAAVAALISKYRAQEWTRVESTSEYLLQKLKAQDAAVRVSFYAQDANQGIQVAARNHFEGITINTDFINKAQVSEAHQRNLFVTLFGVKSRSGLIASMEKFPDAIQTDNVELMIEILRGR
ncbi:hypothetical protein GCM10027443_35920 [Pontibacter brevis]